MRASSGNLNLARPETEADRPRLDAATPGSLPPTRKEYRKPELRRLGRLRSVTGSDIRW
jgi:hypothetical protein